MTPTELVDVCRTAPDWARLIVSLRTHGFTFRSLQPVLHIGFVRLARIQNSGYEPTFTEGSRIIALWREVTNDAYPVPVLTRPKFVPQMKQASA